MSWKKRWLAADDSRVTQVILITVSREPRSFSMNTGRLGHCEMIAVVFVGRKKDLVDSTLCVFGEEQLVIR